MAKCRMSPLAGTTIPRAKLSALLLAHRLCYLVVTAANFRPASLSILGDSQCAIAITRKTGSMLKPYSANRAGEIDDLTKELSSHVDLLHPLATVPGDQNPADMGTRGKVAVIDMTSEVWQEGPPWLKEQRSDWPLRTNQTDIVPREELRPAGASCLAALGQTDRHQEA